MYVFFAHIITHTEQQWSYYVTLLLIIVSEVFVFCFGCYGRAQYLSWVVHQTIVRVFNRYLLLMKGIFHVSSNIFKVWLLMCYLRVPFHQLASPPRISLRTHPEGEPYNYIKNWKTSAVSTTDWMVETQLCKLRDTSDTFVGRAYSVVHL